MAGTRADGIINQPTILLIDFTLNGQPFDAFEFQKVEIYDDIDKARTGNPGDVIETITSGNITKIATGRYQYQAAALSGWGTYFDKIHIIPEDGDDVWNNIHQFYIGFSHLLMILILN